MTRILGILILTLMLAGCSTRLVYNYADWWLEWQIEELVDLTDEQEEQLSNSIDEFFIWHRQTELPRYAKQLESLKQAINDRDQEVAEITYLQLTNVWARSAAVIAPKLKSLLSSLNQEQKQQLIKNIRIRQEEQHKEWLAEQQEETKSSEGKNEKLEKRLSTLEDRLGYVTEGQATSLAKVIGQATSTLQHRIKSRIAWREAFTQALALDTDKSIREDKVTELLIDIDAKRTAQHKQLNAKNRRLYLAWFKQQVLELEEKQRINLNEEIDVYLSDILYLAKN